MLTKSAYNIMFFTFLCLQKSANNIIKNSCFTKSANNIFKKSCFYVYKKVLITSFFPFSYAYNEVLITLFFSHFYVYKEVLITLIFVTFLCYPNKSLFPHYPAPITLDLSECVYDIPQVVLTIFQFSNIRPNEVQAC